MADLYKILRRDFWNYVTRGDIGERANFRNQDLRVYRDGVDLEKWVGRERVHSVVGCYWEADSYFIQVVSKLIYTNRR